MTKFCKENRKKFPKIKLQGGVPVRNYREFRLTGNFDDKMVDIQSNRQLGENWCLLDEIPGKNAIFVFAKRNEIKYG